VGVLAVTTVKVNEAIQPKPKAKFPKSLRLLRHADFERVYKQGRRHFAANMTVFYLVRLNEELTGPRVGFTVGKALGGAVQRNRIKRRLREAVRLSGFSLDVAADVVINPKRSALAADFGELQGEVAKAFQVIEKYLEKGKPR
jgi:ribonuclease P protein component